MCPEGQDCHVRMAVFFTCSNSKIPYTLIAKVLHDYKQVVVFQTIHKIDSIHNNNNPVISNQRIILQGFGQVGTPHTKIAVFKRLPVLSRYQYLYSRADKSLHNNIAVISQQPFRKCFISLLLCSDQNAKGKRICRALQIGLHLISSEFLDNYFRRRFMFFGVEMMPRKGRISFFQVKYSHSNVVFLIYMDLGKLRYIGNFSFFWHMQHSLQINNDFGLLAVE